MQQDEGFHEIQLSGKQLVFLCMATTVVSVLIFLCGVLVGRGVRAERLAAASAPPMADTAVPPTDMAAEPQPASDAAPPSQEAPPPADDQLSYPERLDGQKPTPESLSAAAPATAPPREVAPARAAKAEATEPAAAPPPAAATAGAAGAPGFVVQVASLRDRDEADQMVRRLSGKGYPAFVLEPPGGNAASVFRVRIGGYPTRREAEEIGRKLEKEEQFQPWITR